MPVMPQFGGKCGGSEVAAWPIFFGIQPKSNYPGRRQLPSGRFANPPSLISPCEKINSSVLNKRKEDRTYFSKNYCKTIIG